MGRVTEVGDGFFLAQTPIGVATFRFDDGSTFLLRLAPGSVSDLMPGAAVAVIGEAQPDGSLMASSVLILPVESRPSIQPPPPPAFGDFGQGDGDGDEEESPPADVRRTTRGSGSDRLSGAPSCKACRASPSIATPPSEAATTRPRSIWRWRARAGLGLPSVSPSRTTSAWRRSRSTSSRPTVPSRVSLWWGRVGLPELMKTTPSRYSEPLLVGVARDQEVDGVAVQPLARSARTWGGAPVAARGPCQCASPRCRGAGRPRWRGSSKMSLLPRATRVGANCSHQSITVLPTTSPPCRMRSMSARNSGSWGPSSSRSRMSEGRWVSEIRAIRIGAAYLYTGGAAPP